MEQPAVLSPGPNLKASNPGTLGAVPREALTRAFIRAQLARPRQKYMRGDVHTAARLMEQGDLVSYDSQRFGPLPSTGIPYPQGAGAPGVKVKLTPAAVLVPLIESVAGFSVLLTKRTSAMKKHSGQVAFPGGRMEADDTDAAACAMREAEEETGLPRASVEILGELDPYLTITGYEVTPVVGAVTPPVSLKPDPVEVAEIFEVPLTFLLDPANHRREQRDYNGLKRAYYAMPYGPHYIWGATAGMLLNMYEILSTQ